METETESADAAAVRAIATVMETATATVVTVMATVTVMEIATATVAVSAMLLTARAVTLLSVPPVKRRSLPLVSLMTEILTRHI